MATARTPRSSSRWALLLTLAVLSGCVPRPAIVATPPCAFSDDDRLWLEQALEAWRFASRDLARIDRFPEFHALIFDSGCALTSDDALTSRTPEGVTWVASRHSGEVTLPDGNRLPSSVTSFTSGDDGSFFFAMSTPSVWEAAGVGRGDDLRSTMIAVLLHEASHVAQLAPYGPRLGALIDRYSLPDSFSDDTLQKQFETNEQIAGSVRRETELFLQAAAATDDDEARRLAREALQLLRARQERWFVGDDAYFVEAEDLWLTFEGAGQWLAYQWRIHPRGDAADPSEALQRFTRGRWWSQTEGFAVVMALDRIAGPEWKRHAFGDGAKTVLMMLEEAVR